MLKSETIADLKAEKRRLASLPKPTTEQKHAISRAIKAFPKDSPLHKAALAEREKNEQEEHGKQITQNAIRAIDMIVERYEGLPSVAAPRQATKPSPEENRRIVSAALKTSMERVGGGTDSALQTRLKDAGIGIHMNALRSLLETSVMFTKDARGNWALARFDDEAGAPDLP